MQTPERRTGRETGFAEVSADFPEANFWTRIVTQWVVAQEDLVMPVAYVRLVRAGQTMPRLFRHSSNTPPSHRSQP